MITYVCNTSFVNIPRGQSDGMSCTNQEGSSYRLASSSTFSYSTILIGIILFVQSD